MGCTMSTEERVTKDRNEEIENQIKKDMARQRNEIKMLLLGKSYMYITSSSLSVSLY